MQAKQLSAECIQCRKTIIAEAEARFRTIFSSSPVGIVLADLDSDEILEANDAYCKIVGRSRESIVDNGWQGLTHPDDVAEGAARLDMLRQGKITEYNLLKRYLKPDDEVVWARIEVTLVNGYGSDIGPQYLVTVVDVTERKQFEEQLEKKNTELERFTYTVSHELKSPLVTINGFMGLLEQDLETGDSEKIHKDMQMITSAVRTMGRQLDNLLELSRVGRVVHPSETFSLSRLCKGVTKRMAGVVEQYQGEVNIETNMPDVFADPVRIREVIQNLVENALKFSSQVRPPKITISARLENGKIVCRISDNGPGIDPRYHERVFELFDRLDARIPGTGIGLALVKRNIEVHDGEIWIESEGDGQGTVFCFTLPPT
jgi:PAS domain S-box-containing protein